ncbi:MAG: EVE domain-containing protein [Gemmatimonadota bacterium]|nr:EVE domain-containing protein [Gemmatimonadota bacterium]
MTPERRYYVNTVSRDHVQRGVTGGFTQANHGRPTGLKQLKRGDLIVFYSPKTAFDGGEPLQSFTALGRVADDESHQAEMTPTFRPWRRKLDFLGIDEAPIRPLLEELSFIADKQHWGMPFRRGLFEIPKADFEIIARAMNAKL